MDREDWAEAERIKNKVFSAIRTRHMLGFVDDCRSIGRPVKLATLKELFG